MTFDDGTEDHLRAAEELRAQSASRHLLHPRRSHRDRPDASTLDRCTNSSRWVMWWGPTRCTTGRSLGSLSSNYGMRCASRALRLEEICEEPVVFFAPPGGIGHHALVSTLRSEAYRACRTVRWGIYRDPDAAVGDPLRTRHGVHVAERLGRVCDGSAFTPPPYAARAFGEGRAAGWAGQVDPREPPCSCPRAWWAHRCLSTICRG